MKTLISTIVTASVCEPEPTICQTSLITTKDGKYRIPKAITKQQLYELVIRLFEDDFKRDARFCSADQAKQYLQLKLAHLQHETFNLVYLDSQHQVIAVEELFSGTIDASAVYPRQIVKRCLDVNAAAIMMAHNHPTGCNSAEPSRADRQITEQIKKALDVVDIRCVDHIIVAGSKTVSFAERGLL